MKTAISKILGQEPAPSLLAAKENKTLVANNEYDGNRKGKTRQHHTTLQRHLVGSLWVHCLFSSHKRNSETLFNMSSSRSNYWSKFWLRKAKPNVVIPQSPLFISITLFFYHVLCMLTNPFSQLIRPAYHPPSHAQQDIIHLTSF